MQPSLQDPGKMPPAFFVAISFSGFASTFALAYLPAGVINGLTLLEPTNHPEALQGYPVSVATDLYEEASGRILGDMERKRLVNGKGEPVFVRVYYF
jgi:hypothetical protein